MSAVPRAPIQALLVSLLFAATPFEPAPRAQGPTLNGMQRLIAGERLPLNLPAELQRRRDLAATSPPRLYAPGRVIVKLVDGATASVLSVLSARANARSAEQLPYTDFFVITVPLDADVVAVAADLAAQPGVVYAEPDAIAQLTYVPNDPGYELQWNLQKLGMEHAWDINRGGKSSITVAVIDSGVAYADIGPFRQAPDLAGANFVSPHDFIWNNETPFDLDGHGTHVTGTIGQRTGNAIGVAGMAFNVSIMPIKAIATDWDEILGAPNTSSAAIVAEAIRYAADHGAQVLNLSFRFPVPVTSVRDAITYAIDKGAFVAAAAGNEAESGSPLAYPAAYASEIDGLVAVAAVDYNFNRSYYSNSDPYVEIAAPGGDARVDLNEDGYVDGILQQTLNQDLVALGVFNEFSYDFFQGTSQATPHVSGLAALLMSQGITNPKAVEKLIELSATDVGPPGRDNDTGFGVINPRGTMYGLGLSR